MKNYINTQENEEIMVKFLLKREKHHQAYIINFAKNTIDYSEEIEIDLDEDDYAFWVGTDFSDNDTRNFWFSTYKELMIRYLEDFAKGYELETEKNKSVIKIKKVGFLLNKTKILQAIFDSYDVINYFINNRVNDIICWELGGEDMRFDFEEIGIDKDDEKYEIYEQIYKSAEEDRIKDVISDKNIEDEYYRYSTYKNRGNDDIIYIECKEYTIKDYNPFSDNKITIFKREEYNRVFYNFIEKLEKKIGKEIEYCDIINDDECVFNECGIHYVKGKFRICIEDDEFEYNFYEIYNDTKTPLQRVNLDMELNLKKELNKIMENYEIR